MMRLNKKNEKLFTVSYFKTIKHDMMMSFVTRKKSTGSTMIGTNREICNNPKNFSLRL
jgi:hypothetical protein